MKGPGASVAENIKNLQASAAAACRRAGRDAAEVRIVYVTKTVGEEKVREAAAAGARDFGENRVQELCQKEAALKEEQARLGFRWHMIGHLQTNKVKDVAGKTELIHSLDRSELAEALEKQAAAKGLSKIDCLIQVNTSAEASKFGLAPVEVDAFVSKLKLTAVHLRGLMTIGPLTEDREKIRQAFRLLRLLRDDLQKKFPLHSWSELSMGMSGDYEIAIEEGATLIRVGTAVFGERGK